MSERASETAREIENTRDRLDSEIRELENRLPGPMKWGKRIAGGGTVGGILLLARRMRNRRAKARRKLAPAAAATDRWAKKASESFENGTWKTFAQAAGILLMALRMAELRRLRRTNRALLKHID